MWTPGSSHYAQGFMITSRNAGCSTQEWVTKGSPTRDKVGFPYVHGKVNTNMCPKANSVGMPIPLTQEQCLKVASDIAHAAFVVVNHDWVPKGCYTGPDVHSPKDSQGQHVWIAVLCETNYPTGISLTRGSCWVRCQPPSATSRESVAQATSAVLC